MVDDFVNGAYICRSPYESPEVDGEIIVTSDRPLEVGEMVRVRITAADEYDLTAETI
jgi:ribosomal protein S12 methylthiotransferase